MGLITPHMRKMMKTMMAGKENDGFGNIPMTLELSASHHIVTTLNTIKDTNEPVARIAVEQLFDNACISAGTLDDPRILMSRLNKVLEMFIYQGAGFDYARGEYVERPAVETPKVEEKKAEEKKFEEAKPEDSKPAAEKPSDSKFEEKETDSKFEEVKAK